ncbi:F-box/LRR-repeat protein At4g14096-like [Carex rostrata]
MDPTESRTKRRREIAVADVGVDRISQLPDDLQILILSSLSTKEAFKTSLLAKKLQNSWAKLPDVNLDFDEFLPEDSGDDKKLLKLHAEKFKKFGDRILNNPDKLRNLEKLKLAWVEGDTYPTPAFKWLDTVAKQNLKFLSVHIYSESDFRVPDSIFSCESLEEMELNLEDEIIAPSQESVHLPHLKKLTLRSIFIEDGVMQKLSGLSALEEMVLFDCYLRTCEISSDTLKRLELNGYCNFHNKTGVNETDITISTPHLLYLEVLSCAKGTIKLNKMESLVKACIHYHEDSLFLTGLSNASELELMLAKSSVLEMKDVLKEETSKFPNLKTLKIGEWCMTDEFDVVDHFLSHARNLQKLTLLHCRQEYA